MTSQRFYTYIHLNKDNKPIYVGKGTNKRAYAKRKYDEEYSVLIVDDNISEKQSLELEEFLIQEIGIDNLHNVYTKGNPSAFNPDYSNLKAQIKELVDSNDLKQLRRLAEMVLNDAANGYKIALNAIKPIITRITTNHNGVVNGRRQRK